MTTVVPSRFHARGEAFVDGDRPTRVFGGIPGEAARVRVLHRGGNEVYAEWTGADAPSADRVDPSCPHYRRCGGCPWMHLAPEAARAWRRRRVVDAFAEAGVDAAIDATVPCPDGDTGYRHLVKLVAAPDGDGVRLGAYGRHSHDVGDIGGCVVLHPALRPWTRLRLRVPPGVLRYVVVRRSRANGATLATLIAHRDHPALHALDLPTDGVHLHLHDAPGDALFGPGGTTRLRGLDTLEERVSDTTIAVGPRDFFQTNPSTAARIWADLPRPEGPLLDLFCGVGAVALAIGRGQRVHGVEFAEGAVARARENAARNGVDATFSAGPVATAPIPAGFDGATVVVNPPRSGLGDAGIARVVGLRPVRVAYVSCEPRALARDLVGLRATGLQILRVTPYDMFPQTPHVETVVLLG